MVEMQEAKGRSKKKKNSHFLDFVLKASGGGWDTVLKIKKILGPSLREAFTKKTEFYEKVL